MPLTVVKLGDFHREEIPPPLAVLFKTTANAIIDLTGFTASASAEGPTGTVPGNGPITVSDAAAGEVTYTWVTEDMDTLGRYELVIWVTSGSTRIASDLIVYDVIEGPGP